MTFVITLGEGPFSKWLGKKLKDRRGAQSELGRQLGLERSTVCKWIKGDRLPEPESKEKLAKHFTSNPSSEEQLLKEILFLCHKQAS